MPGIYKYLGVDLYEKYILPTNPDSKNPIIKNTTGKIVKIHKLKYFGENKTEQLVGRKLGAYAYMIFHMYLILKSYDEDFLSTSNIVYNIIVNIYPVFVQIQIIQRVNKILKQTEAKRIVKGR